MDIEKTKIMNLHRLFLLSLTVFCIAGCGKFNERIVGFDPMSNFPGSDTVRLQMQLDDAVFNGIVLPAKDDFFVFNADIRQSEGEKLYYKIYYQNESYKFEEDRPEASENFYGSWEDTGTGFKPVENGVVKDSFRIVGNPRNEKKYFGKQTPKPVTDEEIESVIKRMKNDPKWMPWIVRKSKEEKISLREQMVRDALWVIKLDGEGEGEFNRRERRNPRTGIYRFMLVVATEQALEKIPDYIKDISLQDDNNEFVNPFSFFRKRRDGVSVLVSDRVLKTRAVLTPERGVFVDRLKYPGKDFKICDTNFLVGQDEELYYHSLFEQYFHDINKNEQLNQIPCIADVEKGGYTLEDYVRGDSVYAADSRIVMHPSNTLYPASTISVSRDSSYIRIFNPGNRDLKQAKKENVGIRARVGFSYGKYSAKIKFAQLVNSHGVWTGLTNAFWLAYQSNSPWNDRRICSKEGYVIHSKNDYEAQREKTSNYSEIDIEMIKTSKLWPGEDTSYYSPFGSREFVLACTNWDLACPVPKNFHTGWIIPLKYGDNTFKLHRWSRTYRAITSRVGLDAGIFDRDYYYFEIEWKPDEIIWRAGPSPDKMYVVGYMNEDVTSIPNNQMNTIVTQEFHYSKWWLPELFKQELIPFPENNLEGRVYEIVIE